MSRGNPELGSGELLLNYRAEVSKRHSRVAARTEGLNLER